MTVADYIIEFLSNLGVDTVFMITGGQAMFLNDAVYKDKKIKPIFSHHEQAAAMAAEAYGRISGKLGVAMVTAGPGAINALNGVVGAYVDSSPMMIISGQSSLPTVSYMQQTKIRQFGLQGINIAPVAKTITKYFKTVDDPERIKAYMEEAYFLATTGRPGPVWIEVPLDVQRMEIPKKFTYKFKTSRVLSNTTSVKKDVGKSLEMLYASRRPLIIAGQGIRLAGAISDFSRIIGKVKAPIVTTRLGIDLVNSDNDLFVGRPGLYPDRASNFAIQNSDLIFVFGARLDTGLVGYSPDSWGSHAKKIVVEIDTEELEKPGVQIDLKVNQNLKNFLSELNLQLNTTKLSDFKKWRGICATWKKRYPMVLPKYAKEKSVNSYYFTQRLSRLCSNSDTIVVDTSSPFHVVCQTWSIKQGQRFLTTGGISTMGYWPSAIGASIANGGKRTIVVVGDGSLQMNIQELSTIKQNKLPVKIFVINNQGYLLIRHTQKTHLGGRLMGESPQTGLWCPDLSGIAKAYGLYFVQINEAYEVDKKIKQALMHSGPVLCEIKSPKWQLIKPRVASTRQADGSMLSRPYEDLFPFLPPQELKDNMIADAESAK